MTTPFRDDLAAALARVAELEDENSELRARTAASEASQKTSSAEFDTALTTARGYASRLQSDADDLKGEIAKARAERDALAERLQARDKELAAPRRAPTLYVLAGFVVGLLTALMFTRR